MSIKNAVMRVLWGEKWEEYEEEGLSTEEKFERIQEDIDDDKSERREAEREEKAEKYGSDELRKKVEDKQIEGWSVKEIERDEGRVIMSKRGSQSILGHIVVAILTLWWSFGIGNILYYEYRKRIKTDRLVVRE